MLAMGISIRQKGLEYITIVWIVTYGLLAIVEPIQGISLVFCSRLGLIYEIHFSFNNTNNDNDNDNNNNNKNNNT